MSNADNYGKRIKQIDIIRMNAYASPSPLPPPIEGGGDL